MAFSRIGSTPPQATRSWMSFLAPIGVTVLIIVPVSAALLSSEIEPVDRDEIDSVLDFEETERGVSAQRSSPSGDFATTVSDAPQEPVRRRRGFSPVLGDEEGSDVSDDDDDYDEDLDEVEEEREKVERTPEERAARKAAVLDRMFNLGEKRPELQKDRFLMGPMIDAARRRREQQEGLPPGSLGSEPPEGVKDWRKPKAEDPVPVQERSDIQREPEKEERLPSAGGAAAR